VGLQELFQVLHQRWRTLLCGLALGLVAASAMTLYATPLYASQVTFFVMAHDVGPDAIEVHQASLASVEKTKSYSRILTGDRLHREVGAELGSPLGSAEITGSAEPDTVLLTATVTDPSPDRARAVADAVGLVFPRLIGSIEQTNDPDRPPFVTAIVVDPADVPDAPESPRPVENLILGGVLGLVLGLVMAILRSSMDISVRSESDLREVGAGPLLATLPIEKRLSTQPNFVQECPTTPLAESLRKLRTNLRAGPSGLKRIVVTSAVVGEGKTTTAWNLGLIFARAGLKVVVVDADLRAPGVAEHLRLDNDRGFTSVLRGEVPLESAVQSTAEYGIDVLPSGPVRDGSIELVASGNLPEMLHCLGLRYDLVVLDTPPLLSVTDAADVAAGCDGALLVVGYGKTRKEHVGRAAAALEAAGARLLGSVLTKVPKVQILRTVSVSGDRDHATAIPAGGTQQSGLGDPIEADGYTKIRGNPLL
jgi:capsular exopolysaccharide synthesis family protein